MAWKVAAVLAAAAALAAPAARAAPPTRVEVTELPGWDGPLPSKWFTGYLDGGKKADGRQLWYHYTLILSEGDWKKDPLVLWTNGGPGASSNFGLFTELGPFTLSSESMKTNAFNKTGIPTLFRSEYSWSSLGSLLVLNGPPPVSFSYCDPPGPAGNGFECGAWDDESTARANYQMVESFFRTHPEFASHDFYLTGESYAGIYIPTLAREILKRDPSESYSRRVLKGMAIGDGCVGTDIVCSGAGRGGADGRRELLFKAKFLYGHHQFSTRLYKKIIDACETRVNEAGANGKCNALLAEMDKQVGFYFDYNLYDECWAEASLPGGSKGPAASTARSKLDLINSFGTHSSPPRATTQRRLGALTDYPCGGGGALNEWIKHPEVRKVLGVEGHTAFVSGDNSDSLNYTLTERNLLPFHTKVARETDLRVAIYNGDTDPGLNSLLAEWWVNEMGLDIKEDWRPWTLDGQKKVVGYVTTYEGDFQFITIRGSGHMVPQMKPAAAYEMLRSFLANEPLKPYVK